MWCFKATPCNIHHPWHRGTPQNTKKTPPLGGETKNRGRKTKKTLVFAFARHIARHTHTGLVGVWRHPRSLQVEPQPLITNLHSRGEGGGGGGRKCGCGESEVCDAPYPLPQSSTDGLGPCEAITRDGPETTKHVTRVCPDEAARKWFNLEMP